MNGCYGGSVVSTVISQEEGCVCPLVGVLPLTKDVPAGLLGDSKLTVCVDVCVEGCPD